MDRVPQTRDSNIKVDSSWTEWNRHGGYGITSMAANGLRATDKGQQHNSRQLMDRVEQTWGVWYYKYGSKWTESHRHRDSNITVDS